MGEGALACPRGALPPRPDPPPSTLLNGRLSCCAQGGVTQVVWEVARPYESVVQLTEAGVEVQLEGLSFRHSSPSVANNYAVFVQVGSWAWLSPLTWFGVFVQVGRWVWLFLLVQGLGC